MRIVSTACLVGVGLLAISGANVPTARAAGPVLFMTPLHAAPGSRIQVVAHLRGLVPGSAVEVQVNPPAPATAVLVDVHTHADRSGSLDQLLTFAAPVAGAYIVFVNLGRYADPHSPLKGSSLQAAFPVASSWPLLTMPCGAPLNAIVTCQLAGYGFKPREQVAITYRVGTGTTHGGFITTVYHRTALTDAQGSFVRPNFWFHVDPRVLAYQLTVVAIGAHGGRATTGAAGTP